MDMMDMMTVIYEALLDDPYIAEEAGGRIKFYEYPGTGNMIDPYIVIDALGPPLDSDFADDEPIAEEYLYQIDVWTNDRKKTKELAKHAKKALRKAGFYYYAGGLDEYDADSKIFRDARRFRGKRYTEEFETL